MFSPVRDAFSRVSNTFSTLSKIAVYRSLSRRAGDSSPARQESNPIPAPPLPQTHPHGYFGGISVDMAADSAYNLLVDCAKDAAWGPFVHKTRTFARPKDSP